MTSTRTPRAGRSEWIGVSALMPPCMLVVMDLSVMFLAVPSLREDLDPSATELLWITDAYGFLVAGALIVMGALGPILGGVLLDVSGWHAMFLVNVPAMLAVLAAVPRLVPESANPAGARVDVRCAALLIAAVLPVAYAIKAFAHGDHGVAEWALLAAGVLLGARFLHRQTRLADPLLDVGLFRRPGFSPALAANTLTTFTMFGTFFLVSQYMQLELGLSPLDAALWSLPGLVGMTIGTAVVVPRLAARIPAPTLMASGTLIMVVGLGLLTRMTADSSPLLVSAVIAVFQIGVAPLVTHGMNLILSAAPPEATRAASGTAETCNELGGAMGIALLGSLGTTQGSIVEGMNAVAAVAAIGMLVVAVAIWFGLRERHPVPALAVESA